MPLVIEGTLHHLHANLPTFQEKKLILYVGEGLLPWASAFWAYPSCYCTQGKILKLREALGTGLSI
jgi:hypothetical protein